MGWLISGWILFYYLPKEIGRFLARDLVETWYSKQPETGIYTSVYVQYIIIYSTCIFVVYDIMIYHVTLKFSCVDCVFPFIILTMYVMS